MRKTFKKPPIVEAIYELFVPPSSDWNEGQIKSLVAQFVDLYGGKREDTSIQGINIALGPGGVKPALAQPIPRTRLWSGSNERMIQFGPEMCALNILPPYTRFENYLESIEQLVSKYITSTSAQSVHWIGQRYINRVELSLTDTPSDIFEIYPKIPADLRSKHSPFALQVELMRSNEAVITANLQFQGLQQGSGRPTYLLDIYAKSLRSIKADKFDIIKWHQDVHQHLYSAFTYCVNETNAIRLFG